MQWWRGDTDQYSESGDRSRLDPNPVDARTRNPTRIERAAATLLKRRRQGGQERQAVGQYRLNDSRRLTCCSWSWKRCPIRRPAVQSAPRLEFLPVLVLRHSSGEPCLHAADRPT